MTRRTTSMLMLITGVAAGAALGILFAPKKGRDTRKDIARKSEELYGKLKDLLAEAQNEAAGKAEKVREKVNDLKSEAHRTASKA